MKPKYTSEGLPVISQDTIRVFFRDDERREKEGLSSVIKDLFENSEHIGKTQPSFDKALDRFAEEYHIDKLAVYGVGCFVYNLLIRQAEINSLEGGE